MKIKVEEGQGKPYLENGRHVVEITEIEEGTSENKGIPFFSCRFENEEGFIHSRFYNTEPGMPILIDLFKNVGIKAEEGKELNTQELLNKKVSILVEERTYNDPNTGQEKTIKQASNFQPAEKASTSNATKKK
ncbi:MAG: hypothetical protein M3421_10145 [Bacteroidota bacterium]|jgi:hypothetical protein|nr:hypothetical protein [Bacteroidota bacterium]